MESYFIIVFQSHSPKLDFLLPAVTDLLLYISFLYVCVHVAGTHVYRVCVCVCVWTAG